MLILRQIIKGSINFFISFMVHSRQVTASFFNTAVVLPLLLTTIFFSCIIPKHYQPGKPFVYKTNIKVAGSFGNDEKQLMEIKLENQLDDSLHVRTVTAFGNWDPFAVLYQKLEAPPVFDTSNIARSKVFMVSLLNSLGYYEPVITDTFKIDTVKKQYRTTVNFRVVPGKNLKFDSIGYSLETPELQEIAMNNIKGSLLKKGKPFSKQIVSSEIDRLINLFRDNGYYKISTKDIYAEKDTVLAALIDPTIDPFEQERLLEELKKKRQNPTITVVIKQRPVTDSSVIQKYYIGDITVYPDLRLIDSGSVAKNDTTVLNHITFISKYNKFKTSFLDKNISLRPNNLYKQDDYVRTLNRFNTQLGAWQNARIEPEESETNDSLLNVTIFLYPAKKQRATVTAEGSYNTNDILASNLFGVGLNLGLRDRNAFKQSVQTTTNLRGGLEFGAGFIQTTQASLSHSIYFPHLIPSLHFIDESKVDILHSVLNVNASYTDRRGYFTLRTIGTSWGYEWTKTNKAKNNTHSFIWHIPNIEYGSISKTQSFQDTLNANPTLNEAFKTGFIFSTQFIYNSIKQYKNQTDFLRATAEESGGLLGLIPAINNGELFRFIKGDIEYRHHFDYSKTQLAMRVYGGAGFEYGGGPGASKILPFYKAYYAGGPGFSGTSSMRGWQVRQLGLGSSNYYDSGHNKLFDRFGDVQLEGNIEFRFPLGTIFGIKIKSAFYTDIGNIWDRHTIDTSKSAQGSDFNIGRFYKEFAVDAGTGLRLDFDYFLIRFDWAYKIRDPQRLDNPNRWFYDMHWGDGQFQLGIGYPF
jgi:outer membrane protein insertion porin family